jgi:23S rRNA (adenine2503-C2)-methyltransferase
MNISQISEYLNSLNLPQYRQKQILKNYFSGRYQNFSEMTDLPKDLRENLDKKFSLLSVSEIKLQQGTDTQKVALKLGDDLAIESVLMDYDQWLTACLSSQVGCPLNCAFCATGKMGFKRNLTTEEIIDQILYWNHKLFPKYVGRIVFMGMGEPFLNWDNLMAALKIIKTGLNIGSRKISISTAGVVPKIYEFADLDTEINLAISLHAPNQNIREKIMPISKQYDFNQIFKLLHRSHPSPTIFRICLN